MASRRLGLIEVISGGVLWGASGTVAQAVFSRYQVPTLWLTGVRLSLAGLLLLGWFALSQGRAVWAIWRRPKMIGQLLLFSLLGMVPSQLTYFLAIAYGNAPTATVLQFLGPLFIIIYLAVTRRQWPRRIDLISIVIALFGTFLLVTNGHFTQLALAPLALFWGLLAGVSSATYTLLPRQLLATYDARLVVGWAMLLGSLPFGGVLVTTRLPQLNVTVVGGIAFIVIGGTMLAYLLYLKSLTSLAPSTTGMLSAFEPLTATVLAVGVLGTPLTGAELFDGACIVATTLLQALPQKQSRPK
ncbi:DMT family transporter [Levilactobacillus zymae]|uniref:DMT family transporter n=1 Tax=Levilactobacillus zymae TaxID=267363 RepID=UPI003FCE6400